MPELERYALHRLWQLDGDLRLAVAEFDFNTYVRALTEFCNEDLSAFFFDIRKDCLYCDAVDDPKRRAYRTLLDLLFHALVRYAAPVLVFTAEEVWGTRFPEGGSVHLLEWPELPAFTDEGLATKWVKLRSFRSLVYNLIEPKRQEKVIGSSLEAHVAYCLSEPVLREVSNDDIAELLIVSSVEGSTCEFDEDDNPNYQTVTITRTHHHKCGRCWRHLPEVTEDGTLCARCDAVVSEMEASA
jgi:isoleucyl-tRNA synthetase